MQRWQTQRSVAGKFPPAGLQESRRSCSRRRASALRSLLFRHRTAQGLPSGAWTRSSLSSNSTSRTSSGVIPRPVKTSAIPWWMGERLNRCPGGRGGTSACRGSRRPHCHFVGKELHILCRVVVSCPLQGCLRCQFRHLHRLRGEWRQPARRLSRNWFPRPLPLCASGTSPATSIRSTATNRSRFNAVAAVTGFRPWEGQGRPHVSDAEIGVDSRIWVVGDLCIRHGGRLEKGPLSAVWFTCKREGIMVFSLIF